MGHGFGNELTDKNLYWTIVVDALIEIFGVSPTEARAWSARLAARVEAQDPLAADFFYHAEPLGIAEDLADRRATSDEIDHYIAMRDRYAWDPTHAPEATPAR